MTERARVGVAVVGHGDTASKMLEAARAILPEDGLDGVMAVDAGPGETPELGTKLCDTIEALDEGAGVVLFVDLLGASPCQCATREGAGHAFAVLSGLNLAMLLKLATLDRESMGPAEIANACKESGQKSVQVSEFRPPANTAGEDE